MKGGSLPFGIHDFLHDMSPYLAKIPPLLLGPSLLRTAAPTQTGRTTSSLRGGLVRFRAIYTWGGNKGDLGFKELDFYALLFVFFSFSLFFWISRSVCGVPNVAQK